MLGTGKASSQALGSAGICFPDFTAIISLDCKTSLYNV